MPQDWVDDAWKAYRGRKRSAQPESAGWVDDAWNAYRGVTATEPEPGPSPFAAPDYDDFGQLRSGRATFGDLPDEGGVMYAPPSRFEPMPNGDGDFPWEQWRQERAMSIGEAPVWALQEPTFLSEMTRSIKKTASESALAPKELKSEMAGQPYGQGAGGFVGKHALPLAEYTATLGNPLLLAAVVGKHGADTHAQVMQETGDSDYAVGQAFIGMVAEAAILKGPFEIGGKALRSQIGRLIKTGKPAEAAKLLGVEAGIAGSGAAIAKAEQIASEIHAAGQGKQDWDQAFAHIRDRWSDAALEGIFTAGFVSAFGALHGVAQARARFAQRFRSAKTAQEKAAVLEDAEAFVAGHWEARRMIQNVTDPAQLKRIRERFAGREDAHAKGMVSIIDAKLKGELKETPAEQPRPTVRRQGPLTEQEVQRAQAVRGPEAEVRQEQGRQDIRRQGQEREGEVAAREAAEAQVAPKAEAVEAGEGARVTAAREQPAPVQPSGEKAAAEPAAADVTEGVISNEELAAMTGPQLRKFARETGIPPKDQPKSIRSKAGRAELERLIQAGQVEANAARQQPEEAKAEETEAVLKGDAKLADRLNTMADRLQKQIDDKRADRETNTPRKARMAGEARNDAQQMEYGQRAMRALAEAHRNNAVPEVLRDVRTKTEIMKLVTRDMDYSGGYYDPGRILNTYVDKTPKGRALQAMISGVRESPEAIQKRKIQALEEKVRFANIPGFFATPEPVIQSMMDLADVSEGMTVLEPSAGKGDIADAIKATGAEVTVVELSPNLREILEAKGYTVAGSDFLEHTKKYDRIVMNPPFEKRQDIDHVRHAFDLLKPGGRVVSLMSSGSVRSDAGQKKVREFADLIEQHGTVHDVAQGAFKDAFRSTSVSVKIVVLDKPSVPSTKPKRPKGERRAFVAPVPEAVVDFMRRNFTVRGDLPKPVFDAKVKKEGWFSRWQKDTTYTMRDFRAAAREEYGYGGPNKAELKLLDRAFKGEEAEIPDRMKPVISKMRRQVDRLSRKLIDEGIVEGDLAVTVSENMGLYATRSYRVFDDPKWAKKVPLDVRNRAKAFLRGEYPDKSEAEIDGLIESLLYEGKAGESPIAMLKQSKLGSKDLSVLKRRKGIPEEIRALWGEYEDPRVNYVRSVVKMAHLIANHRFLSEVRAEGLGVFFHEQPVVIDGVAYKTRIAADASSVMYPLNGLYTTPEIKTAFQEAVERQPVPDWLRYYMRVNGIVKFSKTVGSLMTHIRNLLGNTAFAGMNGHWRLGNAPGAWKTVLSNIGAMDSKKYRRYYQKLMELGVVHESARAGELKDVIRDAGATDLDTYADTYAKRVMKGSLGVVQEAYQLEDDVWKVYAFENEKARYRKAKPDWTEEQVEKKAAEIVRNTYPTYSMVPRGIKFLRRSPFVGTFVSFPAEVFRTAKNTIGLAYEELKDPDTRGIGAQRAAGMMLVATGTAAISMASRFLHGVTDDEDEDVRRFLPPWNQNSELFYLRRDEKGRLLVIDLSYVDPHEYLKKPVKALMRGGEVGEKPFLDALKESAEPFLSEEILAERIFDILRNKTKSGGRVYNPQAGTDQIAQDMIRHIGEALEPGTISSFRRVWRGMTGYVSPYGRSYDAKVEALAVFTGQRVLSIDVPQSLSFKAKRYASSMREATSVLSTVANRRGEVTDAELRDAYADADRSKRLLFADIQRDVDAAARLGLNDARIMGVMRAAGLSQKSVQAILDGRYEPYWPSGQFMERSRKLSDELGGDEDWGHRRKVIEQAAQEAGAQAPHIGGRARRTTRESRSGRQSR